MKDGVDIYCCGCNSHFTLNDKTGQITVDSSVAPKAATSTTTSTAVASVSSKDDASAPTSFSIASPIRVTAAIAQEERKRTPAVENPVSAALLKGWTMLAHSCPTCWQPIMQEPRNGPKWCVQCNVQAMTAAEIKTKPKLPEFPAGTRLPFSHRATACVEKDVGDSLPPLIETSVSCHPTRNIRRDGPPALLHDSFMEDSDRDDSPPPLVECSVSNTRIAAPVRARRNSPPPLLMDRMIESPRDDDSPPPLLDGSTVVFPRTALNCSSSRSLRAAAEPRVPFEASSILSNGRGMIGVSKAEVRCAKKADVTPICAEEKIKQTRERLLESLHRHIADAQESLEEDDLSDEELNRLIQLINVLATTIRSTLAMK